MTIETSIRRAGGDLKARLQSVRRDERRKLEEAFLLQNQLLATRDYAEAVIEAVPPLLVLDEKLRVLTADESFCKAFKNSLAEAVNRRVSELGGGQWNIPKLRALLGAVLPRKRPFKDFEGTQKFRVLGVAQCC